MFSSVGRKEGFLDVLASKNATNNIKWQIITKTAKMWLIVTTAKMWLIVTTTKMGPIVTTAKIKILQYWTKKDSWYQIGFGKTLNFQLIFELLQNCHVNLLF